MSGRPPLLRVRGLRVSFGAVRIVDDVSFEVAEGEALGLVGESGSGKSTIARAVVGLAPARGVVEVAGVDVLTARGSALRAARRTVQMVFQDPGGSLNPRMRLGAAIAEPLVVHTPGASRAERDRRVADLMERVGLPAAWVSRYPHELSGGQRQRVAIARALACAPRLLVCDEPTSALDASVQAQVLNLLADLRRDMGLALLFISHDLAVVQHVCDRVAVLGAGRIIEIGERDAVLTAPREETTRHLVEAAGVFTPPCGI